MSHHYSGPNFVFPRGDARLDSTDLFAFPKPGDPGKSILITWGRLTTARGNLKLERKKNTHV